MRTQLTVTGNLTNHPTTRWTKDGVQIAEFGLAYNNRRLDRATGLWEDSEPTFYTVTCWRRLAAHVATSLHKGDPVIVHGRFTTRDYERNDGQHRSELKIEAQAVGPDLNRAIAAVTRAPRTVPQQNVGETPASVPVAVPDLDEDDEHEFFTPEDADHVEFGDERDVVLADVAPAGGS